MDLLYEIASLGVYLLVGLLLVVPLSYSLAGGGFPHIILFLSKKGTYWVDREADDVYILVGKNYDNQSAVMQIFPDGPVRHYPPEWLRSRFRRVPEEYIELEVLARID